MFDVAHMVGEILHTLSPSLRKYPHKEVLDISENLIMDSQPGPIGQIVINLVNNAYMHAFEGRTDGVLTIQARSDGEQILMSFSDNGSGIAIVQNLVTKTLGGRIAVTSTVGHGIRFDLQLPQSLPNQTPG